MLLFSVSPTHQLPSKLEAAMIHREMLCEIGRVFRKPRAVPFQHQGLTRGSREPHVETHESAFFAETVPATGIWIMHPDLST